MFLFLVDQVTLPNWEVVLKDDRKKAVVRILAFGLPKLRTVGDVVADWNVALGSGFFIDSTGRIITNSHVVRKAKVIAVVLSGARTGNFKELMESLYFAELLYDDPDNDVAILKIVGEKFKYLNFSERKQLMQGEPVAALGFPGTSYHDNKLKVVFGFVASGKGENPIILNMSVNAGNSGGPLIDGKGEVVGVVFAREGEGREGLAYAIPNYVVEKVLRSVELRHIKRGHYAGTEVYEAYEELGRGLIKALIFKDYEAAIDHAQKAIELDPDYAEGHFFYGFLAYNYKAYEIAKREYNKAYKLRPSLFDDNYNKETIEKLLSPDKSKSNSSAASEEEASETDTASVEERGVTSSSGSSRIKHINSWQLGFYILRGNVDELIQGRNSLPVSDRYELDLALHTDIWRSSLYVVKNSGWGVGIGSPIVSIIAFIGGSEYLRLEGIYHTSNLRVTFGPTVLKESNSYPLALRASLWYRYRSTPWMVMAALERAKLYELGRALSAENKEDRRINSILSLGIGLWF